MKVSRLLIAAVWPFTVFAAQAHAADETSPVASNTITGTFIAKPYLQLGRVPAAGTLQLLWHTPDAQANWSVEFRDGPTSPWKKTDAPTSRRVAV